MKNPKRDQTEQFRVYFFDSSFMKKLGVINQIVNDTCHTDEKDNSFKVWAGFYCFNNIDQKKNAQKRKLKCGNGEHNEKNALQFGIYCIFCTGNRSFAGSCLCNGRLGRG